MFVNVNKLIKATKAQGGIVSFFIGAMIAVIIALQVTWPVIDGVLEGTSMANLSGAAASLVNLLPLFLILTLVMVFIRPLM